MSNQHPKADDLQFQAGNLSIAAVENAGPDRQYGTDERVPISA